MEGWTLFFMVVILKIPLVAALLPDLVGDQERARARGGATGEDRGPRRKLPPLPRWPRRGPVAGGAPAASRPPCPQATGAGRCSPRAAPAYARRAGD